MSAVRPYLGLDCAQPYQKGDCLIEEQLLAFRKADAVEVVQRQLRLLESIVQNGQYPSAVMLGGITR